MLVVARKQLRLHARGTSTHYKGRRKANYKTYNSHKSRSTIYEKEEHLQSYKSTARDHYRHRPHARITGHLPGVGRVRVNCSPPTRRHLPGCDTLDLSVPRAGGAHRSESRGTQSVDPFPIQKVPKRVHGTQNCQGGWRRAATLNLCPYRISSD